MTTSETQLSLPVLVACELLETREDDEPEDDTDEPEEWAAEREELETWTDDDAEPRVES